MNRDLIRLHVVANSDSYDDQTIKLRVRDAVTAYLRDRMRDVTDTAEAKKYILDHLEEIQSVAAQTMEESGVPGQVQTSMGQEKFDVRHYENFSLPSGTYESLRITLGEGKGKNWWCVVFPGLCLPAAGENFDDIAAGAGFSEALTGALEGQEGYEIRFFLLDVLGKLENILYKG